MPRPTDKKGLQALAHANFDKLFELIDSLPQEVQQGIFPFEDRDRNVRDVLVHLYEWHQLFLRWVKANHKSGKAQVVAFLPEPYNWRTYPDMNVMFWKRHQDTPLVKAKKMVRESHRKVMEVIDGFSDEELFTKQFFLWAGTTSLGSYGVSATSSHYDWAMKKVKRYKRALG